MKEFKKVEDQIEYLNTNKKIIICDAYKDVLLERNYISLINPYKKYFAEGIENDELNNDKHIYTSNTCIKNILGIANIDDSFSVMLHSLIGYFERKLKCTLFYELSLMYASQENADIHCISYIDEIKEFIDSNFSKDRIPKFCEHYFDLLIKDKYHELVSDEEKSYLEQRQNLLKHIYESGTGDYIYNSESNSKSAKLTRHYIEKGEIVPLWVIPSCLTFGELQTVFSISPKQIQQRVYFYFINDKYDSYEKVSNRDIAKFSGYLETIRNIRNIINHYEPLLPFVTTNIGINANRNKPSQLMSVISLLKKTANNSLISNIKCNPVIHESDYNKIERKALKYIQNILLEK